MYYIVVNTNTDTFIPNIEHLASIRFYSTSPFSADRISFIIYLHIIEETKQMTLALYMRNTHVRLYLLYPKD